MGEVGGGVLIGGGDDEPAKIDKVGGTDGRPLGHRPCRYAAQSKTKKRPVKSMLMSK